MTGSPGRGGAAIIGLGQTTFLKRGVSSCSALELTLQAILAACDDAGVSPEVLDGFVSYANDGSEGLAVAAALGVREVRWSSLVWGGGGGGVAAAVNAAATAVTAGEADFIVVYRGLTQAGDGRQSYSKGHLDPL